MGFSDRDYKAKVVDLRSCYFSSKKQLQTEKLKLLPQKTEPQKLHQMEPQRRHPPTAQLRRPLMEQLKLSLQTEPLRQNPQRQKLNLQTKPPLKQQKKMELLR